MPITVFFLHTVQLYKVNRSVTLLLIVELFYSEGHYYISVSTLELNEVTANVRLLGRFHVHACGTHQIAAIFFRKLTFDLRISDIFSFRQALYRARLIH